MMFIILINANKSGTDKASSESGVVLENKKFQDLS